MISYTKSPSLLFGAIMIFFTNSPSLLFGATMINYLRNKHHYYNHLRIILAVLSATSGLICLCHSSILKLQLKHNTPATHALFFGIFSAVLVFFVFTAPKQTRNVLGVEDKPKRNFPTKIGVECVFMAIIWVLLLLIKFPRFYVARSSSCGSSHGNGGGPYTLVSVGAFALSALLLSERHGEDLGLFGVFVELIIDASLEITTVANRPSLGYVFGSVLYCASLIFLKYAMKNRPLERRLRAYRNGLVFLSALVGMLCLFLSPFPAVLFGGSVVRIVSFSIFSFLLSRFLQRGQEYIVIVSVKCRKSFAVKVAVKIALFTVVSLFIFVAKYPRFEIQESCKERGDSVWNEFDVYSAGSFALFVTTILWCEEQGASVGFFSFLVGLTLDASMETLGNKNPSPLSVIFTFVFCIFLILAKCQSDHSRKHSSVRLPVTKPSLHKAVEMDTILHNAVRINHTQSFYNRYSHWGIYETPYIPKVVELGQVSEELKPLLVELGDLPAVETVKNKEIGPLLERAGSLLERILLKVDMEELEPFLRAKLHRLTILVDSYKKLAHNQLKSPIRLSAHYAEYMNEPSPSKERILYYAKKSEDSYNKDYLSKPISSDTHSHRFSSFSALKPVPKKAQPAQRSKNRERRLLLARK